MKTKITLSALALFLIGTTAYAQTKDWKFQIEKTLPNYVSINAIRFVQITADGKGRLYGLTSDGFVYEYRGTDFGWNELVMLTKNI